MRARVGGRPAATWIRPGRALSSVGALFMDGFGRAAFEPSGRTCRDYLLAKKYKTLHPYRA